MNMSPVERLLRSVMVIMTIYRVEADRLSSGCYEDLRERTLHLLHDLRVRAARYAEDVERVSQQIAEAIDEVESRNR